MAETVTMTHPDIDGEIQVHPRGVAVREKAGWSAKKAKPAKKAAAKKPPAKNDAPEQGDETAASGTPAAEAADKKED